MLQMGKPDQAAQLTSEHPNASNYPSWRAEYIATHALARACLGEHERAASDADLAEKTSRVVEVRVFSAACRAIVAAQTGNNDSAAQVLAVAEALGAWGPVVSALRSSSVLADCLARDEHASRQLRSLYVKSNDLGLARRAGFRTRATRGPGKLLTPREFEVLGLIVQGMRTNEIAAALFISPSTTKVHVRHVFEKLGVRTRAEAAARYEMFSEAE